MRNRRNAWTILLLGALALVALGGGSLAAAAGEEEARSTEAPAAAEQGAATDPRVVLYYFHGERRCRTCRTIEAFAEETVRGRFAKQLGSGELAWRAVNFDEPTNEHFIEEFGLVSSSVVLVEIREGKPVRFEVLKKAWSLVRDKAAFEAYIAEAVRGYLG
jgi:hypothetical protein